jgi:excisionase family DNA binding protein
VQSEATLASCPTQGLLTAAESARWLAISPRTLWQLTKNKAIKCIRIGRKVRYDLRDLVEFVNEKKS